MKKQSLFYLVIFCLLFILFLPDVGHAESIKLRVTVSRANIRSEPSTGSEVITQVTIDTILESDQKQGNWFRVLLPPDENGVVRGGFIHNSIVEVIEEPKEQMKEEIPEEIKDKSKEIKEPLEEPQEPKTAPEAKESPDVDSKSFFSSVMKKISIKLSEGWGFFMNGGGDLETLRLETEEFITAMGEPPGDMSQRKSLGFAPMGEEGTDYYGIFNWDTLSTSNHFQFGVNYDVWNNFSVGLSTGWFCARNNDINYSYGNEYSFVWTECGSTYTDTFIRAFTEDYGLHMNYWFINIAYSQNPYNSPSLFTPEFSFGFGPAFSWIDRTYSDYWDFNYTYDSPVNPNYNGYEWLYTDIEENWRASTIGFQISGGIDYNVTPWLTVGFDGFINIANFNNWNGTQEGNWEWGLQRSDDSLGGIYQDDSDSGSWNYGPGDSLYYNTMPVNGTTQPYMSIWDTPPANSFIPSINWNTWGFQFTVKISPTVLGPPPQTRERGRKPPPIETTPTGDKEPPPITDRPDEEEGSFCGPDMTDAYLEVLLRAYERLSDLPNSEKGPWDGTWFLERNGMSIDERVKPARRPEDEEKEISKSDWLCPTPPCNGDNPSGQSTFMLFGHCLPQHVGNDIMYGFAGRMLEVPYDILVMGAHYAEYSSYGSLDPPASRAAYSIGIALADYMSRNQGDLTKEEFSKLVGETIYIPHVPFVQNYNPSFSFLNSIANLVRTGFHQNAIELIKNTYPWIIQCLTCPYGRGELGKDWSKAEWTLSDGSKARYKEKRKQRCP